MKFITEEQLRQFYDENPAFEYELQSDERLTPGARQFLLDKGVNLYEKTQSPIIKNLKSENCAHKEFWLKLSVLQIEYLLAYRQLKHLCNCEFESLLNIHSLLCTASDGGAKNGNENAECQQASQSKSENSEQINTNFKMDYILHIAKLRAKTALLAIEVPYGDSTNFSQKRIVSVLNSCEELLILEIEKVTEGDICR